ncbi:MAG: right-handed parallel beta-helix repeat-containing protein [Anaerolineales bacterium]
MIRKRLFSSLLLAIALIASLWMINLTNAQASPLAARKTPTPAVTPTPVSTVPPGNYYVSMSGNDANAGTLAAPWLHIQYALNRVGAGSTVHVMNGIYNEKVTFPRSGTDGSYIVLQNYTGHAPILDGTGLPISGETGLVTIENKQYVKLIGFEIRNLKAGGVSSAFPQGISVRGNGAFIEIRNNKVHDIENSCRRCGAHGIAVYGRDPNASIHDIIIDGNEVYNGQFGWSESMVLNGNVEFFTVSNNIVHDNDNIGIDFIGFEGENPNPDVDRARDGTVTGNLVYNINSYGNPAYGNERSAGGIYVDGGTRILVERNIVHHSNIGIELASEHAGRNTSYITLRNNFFYNNTQAGIAMGGYDTKRGSTENCVIANNTLYNNFTQGDWGAELYIQFDTRNNIIKNNIISANAFKRYIESWSAVMTGNVVGYNMYFASGGGTAGTWIWKGVTYSTFAAYQAGSGNDANGLAGIDPLLVNPAAGDLHLQSSSPAIYRGQNLSESGTLDIDGQTRIQGAAIDLGADEVR